MRAALLLILNACIVAMICSKQKFNEVVDSAIASVREIQVALFILMIAYGMAEAHLCLQELELQ